MLAMMTLNLCIESYGAAVHLIDSMLSTGLDLRPTRGTAVGDVHGSEVHGCELHGCEVHGCEVHGCEVHGCEVHRCEVHGCELHGCELHGAELPGPVFAGSSAAWATVEDETGSALGGSVLGGSALPGSDYTSDFDSQVQTAIANLDHGLAQALWLVDVCGCTYDEAAVEARTSRQIISERVGDGRRSILLQLAAN